MSKAIEEYRKLLKIESEGKDVPYDKLKALKDKIKETSTTSDEEYQKLQWQELKLSINRQINKLNKDDIREVVVELFKINLERGKGLLVRSVMKAQLKDLIFTSIYASLFSIINSKIPEIGELLGKRLVLQFRKGFMKNNKKICISSTNFLCHLVNQGVISEILILEILQLLLENCTNDSIEIAVKMILAVGNFLSLHSKAATNMIFNRLRDLLHDNKEICDRSKYSIENLFKVRKSKFKDYPIMDKELDLVEEEDRETHVIDLYDNHKSSDNLNVFHFDPNYDENEANYDKTRKEILGDSDDEEEEDDVEENEIDNDEAAELQEVLEIKDLTESRLLDYQKLVYLTVMSSMSSDEAVHKLLKLNFKKQGDQKAKNEDILSDMIIKCCSQEKTYSKYYGVIGEKLCVTHRRWQDLFIKHFKHYYSHIHQFETNALRNIGKFFGHLFASDKLPIDKGWNDIKITEEDTNPAIRIFFKFVLQEMVEELGINEVKERLIGDDYVKPSIKSIFPVVDTTWEDADNLRFSINFFTAIGLGILTEEMRDVLKALPPPPVEERGRSRSRSSSYSRSGSGSYSRSRSGSYSRSRSGSYSRSRSRSNSRSRSRSNSENRSRSFSRSPSPNPSKRRSS